MRMLRRVADEVKPEFYLMGEVIHGEYIRWERDAQIHAVTNYHLHKALYSGHNDHNYFEIAHTVKRLYDMGGGDPLGLRLYNFADNHDVERIYSRLNNKAHFMPLHILMYTLPGIPSVYYGSEFGIEGKKGGGDDWGIRPALELDECLSNEGYKLCHEMIRALCRIRNAVPCLSYGAYEQKLLTNRQYCFTRTSGEAVAAIAVNNDESPAGVNISLPAGIYKAMFSGEEINASGGNIQYELKACSGEIFVRNEGSAELDKVDITSKREINAGGNLVDIKQKENFEQRESKVDIKSQRTENYLLNNGKEESRKHSVHENAVPEKKNNGTDESPEKTEAAVIPNKPYEEMTVQELQAAILQKMAKNGPVTDDMKRSVADNIWHDSLVNWVKSFR